MTVCPLRGEEAPRPFQLTAQRHWLLLQDGRDQAHWVRKILGRI